MAVPLSSKLTWEIANPLWAATLNPIISNPMNAVTILPGISLRAGTNVINHGLGRMMQGWFLTDSNAAATVYRSAALNQNTLTLTASATVTVNIGVF